MTNITKKPTYETIEQAEFEVHNLINKKTNYRDITQIEFIIDGNTKKFSISQISKIKQKLSGESNFKVDEIKNESEQKANLFKLFKNEMTVVDVVIKTKMDSKLVYETYQEYIKLSNMYIVEKKFIDNIEKKLHPINIQYGIDAGPYNDPELVLECASEFLTITD